MCYYDEDGHFDEQCFEPDDCIEYMPCKHHEMEGYILEREPILKVVCHYPVHRCDRIQTSWGYEEYECDDSTSWIEQCQNYSECGETWLITDWRK